MALKGGAHFWDPDRLQIFGKDKQSKGFVGHSGHHLIYIQGDTATFL